MKSLAPPEVLADCIRLCATCADACDVVSDRCRQSRKDQVLLNYSDACRAACDACIRQLRLGNVQTCIPCANYCASLIAQLKGSRDPDYRRCAIMCRRCERGCLRLAAGAHTDA